MRTRPSVKAGSALATVAAMLVIGVPSAGATLSFNPTSHNFGNQTLNTTGTKQFTLTATCDTAVGPVCVLPVGGVHTTNLGITGSDYSLGSTTCPLALNATASTPAQCTLNVHFTPTSAGAKAGSLTAGVALTGNDIAAALSGTGAAPTTGGGPDGGDVQGGAGAKKKKCKSKKRSAAAAKKKKCTKKKKKK